MSFHRATAVRRRPALLLPAVATILATLLLPAAGRANDVFPTSWGGIQFAESDRDEQAANDTHAIAADPDTGGLVAIGAAYPKVYAYRFASDGRQKARFAVDAGTAAIAVVPGGDLFAGTDKARVLHYSAAGAKLGDFSAEGPVVAMAAGADGSVYVATATAVSRYSPAGAKTGSFGSSATLGRIGGVAVSAGNVYVSDLVRRRIEVFDATGTLARTIGGSGPTDGGLAAPSAMGVDGAGNVYVHDTTGGGFDIKLFAADGTSRGPLTNGFFDLESPDAQERPNEPFLVAVTQAGDVYSTPENPDIDRIPASVVPSPRFRFDDTARGVPQFYDISPVAVSTGRRYTLTTNVFRSLSSGLQATLEPSAGLTLAAGTAASRAVDTPAGDRFTPLQWPLTVSSPGRQTARVTVAGAGPAGQPTQMVKTLPIYGLDGPSITIEGAATRRGASYALVAIQVGIGKAKIAKRDRFRLFETLGFAFDIRTTARAGGRPLRQLDFEVGEAVTGVCIPFAVRGTPQILVRAALPSSARFTAAKASKKVRPTSRPRSALLKSCYRSIDLGGGS